jgi:hypothetical protein
MAKLYNRVKVTTATTGTGTVTLGSAASNAFCAFAEAGVQNGDAVTYVLEENNDFEIGRGTYTSSGTTLSRDTVLLSKIGGVAGTSKMSLLGAATVRITAAAQDIGPQHGRCRLALSGSNLVLSPYAGNQLVINGSVSVIPDAGVSLAPTGLAAGTFYYIYAFMNAGTMTLEASTTGHSTQAGTGVEIKTGDATRTLVGAAYTDAGPAWADTDTKRWVLSWFNRRTRSGSSAFTALRSTTSTTNAEISAEIRCNYISWADEDAIAFFWGYEQSSVPALVATFIAIDATLGVLSAVAISNTAGNTLGNASQTARITGQAEAATHFVTVAGNTQTGVTASWFQSNTLSIVIRG